MPTGINTGALLLDCFCTERLGILYETWQVCGPENPGNVEDVDTTSTARAESRLEHHGPAYVGLKS